MVKLEIVCNSIEAAIMAEQCGADRIEYCINLEVGGTTPAREQIEVVKNQLSIPVHIMVCPRAGAYIYTNEEIQQTVNDIENCKSIGVAGVVIGCLNSNNEIDTQHLSVLMDVARPMSVTFHRAFDQCPDQIAALDTVMAHGVNRVLTTGGAPSAFEGMDNLHALVHHSRQRIIILAGGGVRSHNAASIIEHTGVREVHSAAGVLTNPEVFKDEIRKMKHIVQGTHLMPG